MAFSNIRNLVKGGGSDLLVGAPTGARQLRVRLSAAQVNAGGTLLAPLTGYKFRMLSCRAIAIGGAAAGLTTFDISGVQATSTVKLAAFAQANLTQSTVVAAGNTGGAVLADGASFVANDASSAITYGVTGSALTTATSVDVIFEYAIEQ
jgi:hypothetical protein